MAIIETAITDIIIDISAFISNIADITNIAIYLQDNDIADIANTTIYLQNNSNTQFSTL